MTAMRFGDIDGLHRAADELESMAQVAGQQRRAVAGVTAGLVSRDNWGGPAAQSFESGAQTIDAHLANTASTASRTATILRRLAVDLTVAQELAQQAHNLSLTLDGTTPVQPPKSGTAIDHPSPDMLQDYATTTLAEAKDQAERAWRSAAAGLQEIWAPALDGLGIADALGKISGFATAPAAATARRKEVAYYWKSVEEDLRARARSGEVTGSELGRLRDARDLAGARYRTDLGRYSNAWDWTKEGWYANAGRGYNTAIGNVGQEVGAFRGAKGIPVVGVAAGVVSTGIDIQQGVEPTRAVAANGASLLATTAMVAIATGPGAPVVVTAVAIGVLSYGIGNAIHGYIAYGDVWHDFKSDAQWVADTTRSLSEASQAAYARDPFLQEPPLW